MAGQLADAARGRIEDAQQVFVSLRVFDGRQVGNEVLHLLAVKEALRPHHAVGNLVLPERLFNNAALGVGPEQDGEILPGALLLPADVFNVRDDELRFLRVSGHGNQPHCFSAALVGAQRLVPPAQVVADQGVGRVQDGGGAAVILLQLDDGGVREKAFELQDVADLGAAPAVDGLVVVAYHADVVRGPHQMSQQAHLEAVGILELIHGDIAEALLPRLPDVPVLLQQLVRQNQQVVKIHGILRLKLPLVGGGDVGRQVVFNGIQAQAAILHPAHGGQHVLGGDFFRDAAVAYDQAPDQSALLGTAVNGEIGLVPQPAYVLPQDAHAEGMEGAHHDLARRLPFHHLAYALPHFQGGLVRERHGQDAFGADAAVHHVGDAAGDGARLARSGPG